MLLDRCINFRSADSKERFLAREFPAGKLDTLESEWGKLLNGANNEQEVQDFLERHPFMLPGLYDLHNGPLHGVVVAKCPFGADYKSDFAFVTRHSMALQFTFVEIEDPRKQVL